MSDNSKKYKPRVVLGGFTIKWFPKKYSRLMKGNKRERKKAMEYVKVHHFRNESIALNNQDQWCNEQMKKAHLKKLFKRYNIKYSEEDIHLLRNVKVMSESKATYYV